MLLKHIIRFTIRINKTFSPLFLTVFILFIAACTSPTKTATKVDLLTNGYSLHELMAQAVAVDKQASPQKDSELLTIAERLITIGAFMQAEVVIGRIDFLSLNNIQLVRYALNATDIYLRNQSLAPALLLLDNSTLSAAIDRQASIEQQQQFYRNSASIHRASGNILASVEQYSILGTLFLEPEALQRNNDTLWKYLSTVDDQELSRMFFFANNDVLKGWFELAKTMSSSQNNIATQSQVLDSWRVNYPQHPANLYLPTNLRLLQQLLAEQPQHIALLLPLEGKLAKAGQSIRDGFFAAYYKNEDRLNDSPAIRLYDTSANEIGKVYQQAVSNGADLVIGPLSKENVRILSQSLMLSTPVLALNYIDNDAMLTSPTAITVTPYDNNSPSNDDIPVINTPKQTPLKISPPFYQFGLSLEDEAIQVAEKAWEDGHRRALIISSPADWSLRATRAFTQRWQALGGAVAQSTTLDKAETYAENIQQALHIDQSKERASALERLFGLNLEFEPRRRHDVGMIFLVTRAAEGTQIKPTLNFYYASDVPVYATSQLYSSTNSKSKNIDLNDIKLTIMPWLIRNDIPEKNTLSENGEITPDYEKLYALGVDSFLLYSRLSQLSQLSQLSSQHLYGATGKLSIRNNNRIYRQQLWAQMINGKLQELGQDSIDY
ncbi:MAG: outer membrane PBP1 activator LpoA protein [Candidatus Endobugula sp.]|jgi:outer membrane PBP1 activator LpoA protein